MNGMITLSVMAMESLRLWLKQSPPALNYAHPSPESETWSFMSDPESGACILLESTSLDWYRLTVQADECWSFVEFRCDMAYFAHRERYEPPFRSAFEDISCQCLLPAVINLFGEFQRQVKEKAA